MSEKGKPAREEGPPSQDRRPRPELLLALIERNAPITYRGPEVTRENLGKLQEVGLLQDVREEGGNLHWSTTKKGEQLHAIIFDQVVVAIRSG